MKNKPQKEFDTVKFFRDVKEKIAKDTKGMSFAGFKEYMNRGKLKQILKKIRCALLKLRFA